MVPHHPKRRKLAHDGEMLGEWRQRHLGDREPLDGLVSLSEGQAVQPLSGQTRPNARHEESKSSKPKGIYPEDIRESNIFQLQVDAMLLEVQPDYAKLRGPVDKTLRTLKTLIDNMEDQAALTIVEATKLMRSTYKISIPFPDPNPPMEITSKFQYLHPSSIDVVGSYPLMTMVKGGHTFAVDMVITLPLSIFEEKDYLNYGYFYKRAYYLTYLAAGLRGKSGHELDFSFEYLAGNSLQPILIAKPSGDGSNHSNFRFQINIIPAAPEGFFPEARLRPKMNAIRPKRASVDENKHLTPTPFYNATIRADSNVAQYWKLLNQSSRQANGFRGSCMLGRIWLHQRGFRGTVSTGGFGHFEWAILSALLFEVGNSKGHGIVSPSYGSYQLFRAVIRYLSKTDLVENPVRFHSPDVLLPRIGLPTFYDGLRGHNILFKMTPWSYAKLKEEAKITLEMLSDAKFGQFESIFILNKDNPLQQFDRLFSVPLHESPQMMLNLDHPVHRLTSHLYEILNEGLSDRVSHIQIMTPEFDQWSLACVAPAIPIHVLVGVNFDPAKMNRAVDHGPAAEDTKAAACFRKFWGEKAELRRFKDGSIVESLLWSNSSGSPIFNDVVNYLITRHFGAETSTNVKIIGNDVSRLLLPSLNSTGGSFTGLRVAFNILQQHLQSLESLPLQVKSVLSIAPQLRFSSIEIPRFSPRNCLEDPVDVLVQFEGSGRWPDDLTAIQLTKIPLLRKIGSILENSVDGLTLRFGLENPGRPLSNCAVLDIFYPTGAVFRLRIHIDREQTLLERQIKDNSIDRGTREQTAFERSLNTYMFQLLPLHTQSMATYCTRYIALSETTRLVKKWFESHMLSSHFRGEVIELIVARTFLQPSPWRAPSSPNVGLLRTLQFLSRWDWRTIPLIVDFGGKMTKKEIAVIYSRLEAWRKIDPGMNRIVLFTASNHDLTGTAFTDAGPSSVIAARMTALARSACTLVKAQGLEIDLKCLFKSSTSDYDFVLHISPIYTEAGLHRKELKKLAKLDNLTDQAELDLSCVHHDPVGLFVEELTRIYAMSVVFFHDSTKKSVICGLWNPSMGSRPFRINLSCSTKPMGQKQLVQIDKNAILAEIARLGNDIVTQVDVHQ